MIHKKIQIHPLLLSLVFIFSLTAQGIAQKIPLPEHPRPDFQRPLWENLNGNWDFQFDPEDRGLEDGWESGEVSFEKQITVPFPWGSALSGLEDAADIGWYSRQIRVDPSWKGKRVFLTIGASDWKTTVWIDGHLLGTHRGGYVPFSFELTDHVEFGKMHSLVIRVDDARRDFTLYGKQGYGNARGIWQTVYLEARGPEFLEALHLSPDIDRNQVEVTAYLPEAASKSLLLKLEITTPGEPIKVETTIPEGEDHLRFTVPVPDPRLWDLEDPYLYSVTATLEQDRVETYFGMRKISVVDLPGLGHPYIALNNEPVYLQLALDQSYHPDGYYTFPSDAFMKEEIERSKSIGLNGIRIHIKVEVPRKLYWADKLGLLVMADLPNSWGEPDKKMKEESEYTLREMIRRDFNHPSIFSWVVFNETWGLYTNTGTDENGRAIRRYLPETQQWVASMYYLTKSLDMTRLVEDNSICCGRGHTETDINSWHAYLPGWAWENHLSDLVGKTYPGSTHHFEEGFKQDRQPNINSECGNVWGYRGSTGDVDWSWDYHRMINTFRKYPKVAGWLYTEHHDVINEWNGYWRFDRSEKETGLGQIVDGMTLNDLHSDVYLSTGNEICRTVEGGSSVSVPLWMSVMTGRDIGGAFEIAYELAVTNPLGEKTTAFDGSRNIEITPWMQKQLPPLNLEIPDIPGIGLLTLKVKRSEGEVLHRNFMHFEIVTDTPLDGYLICGLPADGFRTQEWSRKQWNVRQGRKVNGAGSGFFEYAFAIPENLDPDGVEKLWFVVEASAKQLFVKDMEDYDSDQDFMRGSKVSPSANPNSYPMTDETQFPSEITVTIDGEFALTKEMPDDPADHRGVLSWHYQLTDRRLREAGSYGYMLKVPVSKEQLNKAAEKGEMIIRLSTEADGGIAIYGKQFGRYALDPSLVIRQKPL